MSPNPMADRALPLVPPAIGRVYRNPTGARLADGGEVRGRIIGVPDGHDLASMFVASASTASKIDFGTPALRR